MDTDKKINNLKDGVHTIRGHLSAIWTLLELEDNPDFAACDRVQLLDAAKKSLTLVCRELTQLGEQLSELSTRN